MTALRDLSAVRCICAEFACGCGINDVEGESGRFAYQQQTPKLLTAVIRALHATTPDRSSEFPDPLERRLEPLERFNDRIIGASQKLRVLQEIHRRVEVAEFRRLGR